MVEADCRDEPSLMYNKNRCFQSRHCWCVCIIHLYLNHSWDVSSLIGHELHPPVWSGWSVVLQDSPSAQIKWAAECVFIAVVFLISSASVQHLKCILCVCTSVAGHFQFIPWEGPSASSTPVSRILSHQRSLKLCTRTLARLSPSWYSSLILSGMRSSDNTCRIKRREF